MDLKKIALVFVFPEGNRFRIVVVTGKSRSLRVDALMTVNVFASAF